MARRKPSEIRKEIEDLLQNCLDLKQKMESDVHTIDQNLQNVNTKVEEVDSFYNEFEELRDKIRDENNGLEKVFEEAVGLKNTIQETKSESSGIRDNIFASKISSDTQLKEIKFTNNGIKELYKESEDQKETIGKILELVTDSGLANSFDKRRIRLLKSVRMWMIVLISSVVFALFLLIVLFGFNENVLLINQINEPVLRFIFKLTLTSPLVFLIWFSSIQYGKEKFLLEQYEFKTATSLALESYTYIVKERFPDKSYDKNRFQLMLDLIANVYKEPIYLRQRMKFSGKTKEPSTGIEAEVGAEEEEVD